MQLIGYELSPPRATITIDDPDRHNPLSAEAMLELRDAIGLAAADDSVRVIVITGAGDRSFSAGGDLKGGFFDDAIGLHAQRGALASLLRALRTAGKPTIARVNGHALGGGFELALTCDFRFIAAGGGRVGLPEVRLGMIPAFGGTQRLTQLVGKAKALELMFKGLQLAPEEALQAGLVTAVLPTETFYDHCLDYAARLARQATGAIASIKSAVNIGLREGFTRGMEEEARVFRENIRCRDAKEGIDAFLEGRKPRFEGR